MLQKELSDRLFVDDDIANVVVIDDDEYDEEFDATLKRFSVT